MSARPRLVRAVLAALVVGTLTAGGVAAPALSLEPSTGQPFSGTITAGGAPLAGVTVYATTGSGASTTVTDGDGNYSFGVTVDSDLKVFASNHTVDGNNWAPTWYGDTAYASEATVLTRDGARTGIDIDLLPANAIFGTVSVEGAPDLAGVTAFLYNPSSGRFESSPLGEYGSPWYTTTNLDGTYSVRNLPAGQYLLRFGDVGDQFGLVTQYWPGVATIDEATLTTVAGSDIGGRGATLQVGGPTIERLAGADRFQTAVEISQAGYPDGAEWAFVVNGLTFPDALSAGPAAAQVDAPVLPVTPDGIPDSVADELERLDPDRIVIVGGAASVSDAVAQQLAAITGDAEAVIRISGGDRFETSRHVAEQFWQLGNPSTVYVSTGANFPDALGAGAAAGAVDGPLILVQGTATDLDSASGGLLASLGASRVVIVGGEASVSAGIAADIRAIPGISFVSRHSGKDRYRTAASLGLEFPVSDTVYLATGANFPDALAGAALAGDERAPIYLVQQNCVSFFVLLELGRLNPSRVVILGGEASVGAGAANLTSCGDQDGA